MQMRGGVHGAGAGSRRHRMAQSRRWSATVAQKQRGRAFARCSSCAGTSDSDKSLRRFSIAHMTTTAVDVKRDVAIANRVLWALGLCTGVTASLGHASLRLPDRPDRFLVKGRGYKMDALAAMRPEEMVTCDLDGNLVDGPPGASQCFEV